MTRFILLWLLTVPIFFLIDLVWLGFVDIAWGTVLSATVATLSYLLGTRVLGILSGATVGGIQRALGSEPLV